MKSRLKTLLTASVVLASSITAPLMASAEDFRVAYVARTQSDSFAAWLANSIVAEGEKFDDMEITVFDGQSRNELIQTHIENAVQNQFDLMIIQPYDPYIQEGPVLQAMDQGMMVVATNPKFDNDAIPSVDANPYQQGAENAILALDQIPEGARVVILNGPAGNPHSMGRREAWQTEFFDKRPDVTILDEQIANWNKDEGLRLMEDWIQAHGKIDAVISMNDNMAAGAIEAAKAAGGDMPLVYGVDGTAEAVLLIKEGLMTSTTLQNANALAEMSVQLAHDMLTGAETEKTLQIQAELITADNADQYIALHKELGNIQ